MSKQTIQSSIQPDPVDPVDFRRALSCFATGVAIATATDTCGKDFGMTISSFNSVSMDPPLILWSIGADADAFDVFVGTEYFAINVLARHQERLSGKFAESGGDKFAGIEYRRGIEGVPVLAESAAFFECKTEHVYAGGDHKIIIGRVLRCADTAVDPLVYFNSRFL